MKDSQNMDGNIIGKFIEDLFNLFTSSVKEIDLTSFKLIYNTNLNDFIKINYSLNAALTSIEWNNLTMTKCDFLEIKEVSEKKIAVKMKMEIDESVGVYIGIEWNGKRKVLFIKGINGSITFEFCLIPACEGQTPHFEYFSFSDYNFKIIAAQEAGHGFASTFNDAIASPSVKSYLKRLADVRMVPVIREAVILLVNDLVKEFPKINNLLCSFLSGSSAISREELEGIVPYFRQKIRQLQIERVFGLPQQGIMEMENSLDLAEYLMQVINNILEDMNTLNSEITIQGKTGRVNDIDLNHYMASKWHFDCALVIPIDVKIYLENIKNLFNNLKLIFLWYIEERKQLYLVFNIQPIITWSATTPALIPITINNHEMDFSGQKRGATLVFDFNCGEGQEGIKVIDSITIDKDTCISIWAADVWNYILYHDSTAKKDISYVLSFCSVSRSDVLHEMHYIIDHSLKDILQNWVNSFNIPRAIDLFCY